MASTEYDPEEFIDIALNSVFPSTEEIDSDILKEITVFLEENENKVPLEDAEMVRGEIRKALIHFKNRPYLFKTRKKMEDLLKIDGNWKRFIVAPHDLIKELKEAGLNKEEIDLLKESLQCAENSYDLIKSIPTPKN
ncbi:MAG: hypothetical protein HGN29_13925 [Asgard group archaeon]|nr:hypothetical protein [Asgard group archaeon]